MKIREAIPGDELGLAKVKVNTWLSTYKALISEHYLEQLNYQTSTQKWNDPIFNKEMILLVA